LQVFSFVDFFESKSVKCVQHNVGVSDESFFEHVFVDGKGRVYFFHQSVGLTDDAVSVEVDVVCRKLVFVHLLTDEQIVYKRNWVILELVSISRVSIVVIERRVLRGNLGFGEVICVFVSVHD